MRLRFSTNSLLLAAAAVAEPTGECGGCPFAEAAEDLFLLAVVVVHFLGGIVFFFRLGRRRPSSTSGVPLNFWS
jgi:hypothetical protein